MASPPPPRGRSWASGDDALFVAAVVIAVALGVIGYMSWSRNHAEISRGFALLAHWHIQLIQYVTDDYDGLDRQLLGADYGRVTLGGIHAAATSIGLWFRIPVAVLLGVLAVACFVRSPSTRYRRRFDLDGLIAEQAKSFRTTAAFAARRLRLRELRPGGDPRPADPALQAPEWLDRYAVRYGEIGKPALQDGLVRQLGSRWCGAERAAPHVRVLFAAFALHCEQRHQDALALLGELSEGLRPSGREGATGPETPLGVAGPVVARADAVIASGPAAAAQAARHAFTAPALMTVLVEARRRGGVLPPAAFNAVKLVDRQLWYALHSLGFPSEAHGRTQHPNSAVEAIGARDHWAVECSAGRAVGTPSVERAVAALLAFHAQSRRNRDPDLDTAHPSPGPSGPGGPTVGVHAA